MYFLGIEVAVDPVSDFHIKKSSYWSILFETVEERKEIYLDY